MPFSGERIELGNPSACSVVIRQYYRQGGRSTSTKYNATVVGISKMGTIEEAKQPRASPVQVPLPRGAIHVRIHLGHTSK